MSDIEQYTGESTGLEDFDADDMVMPTITINHDDGKYVDSLSGEEFGDMEVVILGLIKQRVLWAPEVEEGKKPMCRSYNHKIGRADPVTFPWKASGFVRSEFEPADYEDGDPIQLPCESCPLKEWGTHPKTDAPWCKEQYKLALMIQVGEGVWSPAIITLQGTAVTPIKKYLTSFARSQSPTFLVTTKMGLDLKRKGSRNYAVPNFVKGSPTDAENYDAYKASYRRIRAYLTTPRSIEDEDAVQPNQATTGGDAAAPNQAPAGDPATTPAGNTVIEAEEVNPDDIPF